MTSDEKAIIDYLKSWPHSFVSGKEIARKASGKKRFDKEPNWATPLLLQMVKLGLLQNDFFGGFKLIEKEDHQHDTQRFVSPQMLKILKTSGKSFDGVVIDEDEDGMTIPYRKPGSAESKAEPN